jgi:hypothetical protein
MAGQSKGCKGTHQPVRATEDDYAQEHFEKNSKHLPTHDDGTRRGVRGIGLHAPEASDCVRQTHPIACVRSIRLQGTSRSAGCKRAEAQRARQARQTRALEQERSCLQKQEVITRRALCTTTHAIAHMPWHTRHGTAPLLTARPPPTCQSQHTRRVLQMGPQIWGRRRRSSSSRKGEI